MRYLYMIFAVLYLGTSSVPAQSVQGEFLFTGNFKTFQTTAMYLGKSHLVWYCPVADAACQRQFNAVLADPAVRGYLDQHFLVWLPEAKDLPQIDRLFGKSEDATLLVFGPNGRLHSRSSANIEPAGASTRFRTALEDIRAQSALYGTQFWGEERITIPVARPLQAPAPNTAPALAERHAFGDRPKPAAGTGPAPGIVSCKKLPGLQLYSPDLADDAKPYAFVYGRYTQFCQLVAAVNALKRTGGVSCYAYETTSQGSFKMYVLALGAFETETQAKSASYIVFPSVAPTVIHLKNL